MSNFNNITSKIITKAEDKKNELLSSAHFEKKDILQKHEEKAIIESDYIIKEESKNTQMKRDRLISNAKLKVRDDILKIKQEKIQEVFTSALKQLENMNELSFHKFLEKALLTMEFQGEVMLILGEKIPCRNILEVVEDVNNQLTSTGTKVIISSEIRKGINGFIIEQNGVELNYSFSALIEFMKERLEYEVASTLFN